LIYLIRKWHVLRFDTSSERADALPLAIILAVILVWPIALELGRWVLAFVAVVLVAVRVLMPLRNGRFGRLDVRPFGVGALAVLATLAFYLSWTVFVLMLCVIATITTFVPRWAGSLAEPEVEVAPKRSASLQRLSAWTNRDWSVVSTVLLGGFGALIGVWLVGEYYWSPDNTYYLNKAAHYAASPTSFAVRDYMFGLAGTTHYPFGDILSSFEPLLGTASAISHVSVSRLLFQLTVPVSMFLVPYSVRYAARGLHLRRANLVAAFGAAVVLLMTANDTYSLPAVVSLGKTIGRLVFIPLVIGATADLLRRKDPGASLRATLASVCAVGCSPSLALPARVIVTPFTAAGLWDFVTTRAAGIKPRLPALVSLCVPSLSERVFDHGAALATSGRFVAERAAHSPPRPLPHMETGRVRALLPHASFRHRFNRRLPLLRQLGPCSTGGRLVDLPGLRPVVCPVVLQSDRW
jgi:hypothetical protein